MKALQITGYGEIADNVENTEIPTPLINDDQVLIEIRSAGVNPVDYKIVKGAMKKIKTLNFPAPIGFDLSGIVVGVGQDITNLTVGDEVYARVPSDTPGTFAEFIAVDASVVVKKPGNITHNEASGIPLVGVTTVQALKMAGIKKGDSILIHAGSGGVGSFAIQYAKALGATVYTTTSSLNVEWVKELGADRVIDYKNENYLDVVSEVDIVFDTLGGSYSVDAFKVLKKGGFVVSIAGPIDGQTAKEWGLSLIPRLYLKLTGRKVTQRMKKKSAQYRYFLMSPDADQLNEISTLIEAGKIHPVTAKVFPLSEGVDALKFVETGRAKGKVILQVK
ncbi:NADP-dependent oxidoreductase [Oceanispirochaeta sp.]|jgi:NADPH:quinone reductase-like Zn-dependent oxidoreductase|uniref:NADP-dependent oxidoreductase n=1 Tax=Oceanispirochaeta sp. TaxID=2035350 RepID=UPI002608937F|nr:NADP-dependent oxidoreductase [Oceanispirochaeta sp.]MDA3955713.1 NADP-dependent oxidoreductase [Oceanispirochaeta sp.]